MKSRQKKMPAKKLKQQRPNMKDSTKQDQLEMDFSDLNEIVLTGSSGYDSLGSLTIDTSNFSSNYITSTSTTSPCVVTYNSSYVPTWTTSGTSGSFFDNSNAVIIDTNGVKIKEGGDIKIGEKSLIEILDKIEERLAILKVNSDLENKWERLKQLGDEYRALEKDLLEKEKIMDILKKT